MARIIASIGVFIAVSAVAVYANDADQQGAANVKVAGVVRGMAYYGNDYEDRGCCHHECCEPRECCEHHCCGHHVPDVTVHVIQPPPTYIYDLTQTACYTEHIDCCGCPYVCGPTCIPQGEVLAPCNVGKRVVVADHGCKRKCH